MVNIGFSRHNPGLTIGESWFIDKPGLSTNKLGLLISNIGLDRETRMLMDNHGLSTDKPCLSINQVYQVDKLAFSSG